MASQSAFETLNDILKRSSWAQELAGILPLSFLIDFIDTPPKLHILQLVGTVPGWSWVITPSSGRLLLSQVNDSDDCCQDVFGATRPLEVLDGRYGDRYFASSPETFRLILGAHKPHYITNKHKNMLGETFEKRCQDLDIVYISRANADKAEFKTSSRPLSWSYALLARWKYTAPRYTAASCFGWILFCGLTVASALLKLWLALAFFSLIFTTGLTVDCLHGSQTRQLRGRSHSPAVRLLVVTEHMNSGHWIVIMGESNTVNCLMNRSLKRQGPSLLRRGRKAVQHVLRFCILGQWVAAIAAAVTKGWSSYIICFWQCFTIVSHAFLLTPRRSAQDWATRNANITIRRFRTQASTRRALLNTIVALNPDTLEAITSPSEKPPDAAETPIPDAPKLSRSAMSWIDPILAACDDRSRWEQATREALFEYREANRMRESDASQLPETFPSKTWQEEYYRNYWAKFIPEGIHLAAEISRVSSQPD